MSDRLWSPQMRKWIKDSNQHGLRLRLEKHEGRGGFGGGIPYNLYGRAIDAGAVRSVDNSGEVRVTDNAP